MDAKTTAYLRERRSHSGGISLARDAVSAAVGALAAAAAGQSVLWGVVGAAASVVLVEVYSYVHRFVWVAPKEMYFEGQRAIRQLERKSNEELEALQASHTSELVDRTRQL
jgi:hypothetical protein